MGFGFVWRFVLGGACATGVWGAATVCRLGSSGEPFAWCVGGRDPWRSAWGRRLNVYVCVRFFGRATKKYLGCFPEAIIGVVGCRRSVKGFRAGMFRRRVALGGPGVLILGLFIVVWRGVAPRVGPRWGMGRGGGCWLFWGCTSWNGRRAITIGDPLK